MSHLYVKLQRARNLASRDTNGFSDPYAILTLESEDAVYTTVSSIVEKTLNPTWNDEWVFAMPEREDSECTLSIELWDRDFGSKDDFLGSVTLKPFSFRNGEVLKDWYRLVPESKLKKLNSKADLNISGFVFLVTQFVSPSNPRYSDDDFNRLIPTYLHICNGIIDSAGVPPTFNLDKSSLLWFLAEHGDSLQYPAISSGILGITTPQTVLPLIFTLIRYEVGITENDSNLFRANSICTSLMTGFGVKMAKKFVQQLIQKPILDLEKQNLNLEVQPVHLDPNTSESTLKKRHITLIQTAKSFLDSVAANIHLCPKPLLEVGLVLHNTVKSKFSQNTAISAVGSLFFLRIICPAIVSPDSFGIIDHSISSSTRRNLLLVAKLLQYLANNITTFNKAPYLQPCQSFLTDNRKQMVTILCSLSNNSGVTVTATTIASDPSPPKTPIVDHHLLKLCLNDRSIFDKLVVIHGLLLKHFPALVAKMPILARTIEPVDIPTPSWTRMHDVDLSLLSEVGIIPVPSDAEFLDPYHGLILENIVNGKTADVFKPTIVSEAQILDLAHSFAKSISSLIGKYSNSEKVGFVNRLKTKSLQSKKSFNIDWVGLERSPEFAALISETAKFSLIDITALTTDISRISFWLNIYHFLTILDLLNQKSKYSLYSSFKHLGLKIGAIPSSKNISLYPTYDTEDTGIPGDTFGATNLNESGNVSPLSGYYDSWNIDANSSSLVFTAPAIQYGILLGNIPKKTSLLNKSSTYFNIKDPLYPAYQQQVVTSKELISLAAFSTCEFTATSPPLFPAPATLSQVLPFLKKNATVYLSSSIQVNLSKNQFSIPFTHVPLGETPDQIYHFLSDYITPGHLFHSLSVSTPLDSNSTSTSSLSPSASRPNSSSKKLKVEILNPSSKFEFYSTAFGS